MYFYSTRLKISSLLSALLLSISVSISPTATAVEPIDKMIAIVGDDIIFSSELDRKVTQTKARLTAAGKNIPRSSRLETQLLDQLILERLQLFIAQNNNISATPSEIKQTIQRTLRTLAQQGITFEDYLTSQRLTEKDAESIFANEIIIDKIQKAVINQRINITDREVDNFLSSKEGIEWLTPRFEVGHLFLAATASNKTQVMKNAQKIYTIARQANTNFKALAQQYSQGQNAAKGGDLGALTKDELPPLFVSQLTLLDDGDISQPFISDAGVHILKLYSTKGAKPVIVDRYEVRHLLITPSELFTNDEAKRKVDAIYAQLNAGEEFNTLAEENTDDIASKLNGGSLGWSMPGQFVPEFEAVMASTAVGTYSQPFSTQFGWHILKIDDTRKEDVFESVKPLQVKQLLRQQRFNDELQVWLKELRDNAYVEILN